jgi:L-fuconolactonase
VPTLRRNRFDGSVVVQANALLAETRWLLELADAHEWIRGVVGWVDLTDPMVGRQLDEFQQHPKFKGVRHIVHDEPEVEWLLRVDVLRGLHEVSRRGLPYDLLLRPVHLPLVPRLMEQVPDLRAIVDHISKPLIAQGLLDGWAQDMERTAQFPQIWCKLSGMITEADHRNWRAADLQPYVQHVFELFGPDRLVFGSDWPVCLLACERWKQVLAACTQALGPLAMPIREKIFGENAVRFYGLGC